ncbi:hypothetical protein ACRAWD_05595 [Caulobacter segnis]
MINSFLVPTKISSAVARRRGQGRPLGRRAARAFLDGDEHGRTLQHVDGASRRVRSGRRVLVAALVAVLLTHNGRRAVARSRGALGIHIAQRSRQRGGGAVRRSQRLDPGGDRR